MVSRCHLSAANLPGDCSHVTSTLFETCCCVLYSNHQILNTRISHCIRCGLRSRCMSAHTCARAWPSSVFRQVASKAARPYSTLVLSSHLVTPKHITGQHYPFTASHHISPPLLSRPCHVMSRSSTSTSRPTHSPSDVRVLVPIDDGTEEVEATSIITVFRRAGCHVTVASTAQQPTVTGARGAHLTADTTLAALQQPAGGWTAIALPGGKAGAEHFRDTPALIQLLRRQRESNRLIAAICASPSIVLQPHGLLPPHRTGHPSFELTANADGGGSSDRRDDGRVVYDKEQNTVTSLGPGSAIEFALFCVGLLCGDSKMAEVAQPMCLNFTPQPTAKL